MEKLSASIPTVAIVGRPNVGKSALFNAIIGKRISIVHEESGVTRDNIIYPVKYNNCYFQIIDTGGLGFGKLIPSKNSSFWDSEIAKQVTVAIDSADILLMVVDVMAGVVHLDEEVANTIRKSGKRTILVINKVDNKNFEDQAEDFAKLGFKEIYMVSCVHRIGITDLLESLTKDMSAVEAKNETRLNIAVIGRPNVGKSSIVNKLLGDNKLIVSKIAGTTRDAVDTPLDLKLEEEIIPSMIIDTAGLRKKGRADSAVEIFSIMRAKEAIERADIVLFVIESAEMGATAQDANIGKIISDAGKACIIVANKWDECKNQKQVEVREEIRRTLPFLAFAPIVFTCAVSGYNFKFLLIEIKEVNEQFKIKIPTSALNKMLSDILLKNPPPCVKSRFFKIYYATQVSNKPPVLSLFVNDPAICPQNYMSYLKNEVRKACNLKGLPIILKLIKRLSEPKGARMHSKKKNKRK
ncbi:MAG TPA: ribosome biogenesis GTPase Der [Lentisphaeria bacterium]|nr:MAG: ribosome biogenesis GTPase Der [Lentisphaerae bacterium GWF2_38_69]HBM17536.1 ribosome biogenesis GTPase Der [Lentisphaeria bacterium]